MYLIYCDNKFTWSNNQEGLALIKERLDMEISYRKWLVGNDLVKVSHLCAEESDHSPILIHNGFNPHIGNILFRFLQAWTSNPTSVDVIHTA